jgi:hypothetical protein
VQEYFNPLLSAADRIKVSLDAKLTAFLRRERLRIEAEQAAARKAAEDAERRAAREADRAMETLARAERGELAGTGINTMAQMEYAEAAQIEAEQARARANALDEKTARAGGSSTIGGLRRATTLRTTTSIVLDVPAGASSKTVVTVLQKILPFLEANGKGAELRETIGRLVNAVYRDTEKIAPGCKAVRTERAQ